MKNEKPNRTQFLSYKLLDTISFSPIERSILQIINTRPHYYINTLANIGILINRSARTVQRAIKSLIQKGVIDRSYCAFKRLKLKLPGLKTQELIAKNGIAVGLIRNLLKSKKRHHKGFCPDTTSVSQLDTTSVSPSINNKEEKNSTLNTDKNLGEKFNLKPKFESFEAKKRDMLARFIKRENLNL